MSEMMDLLLDEDLPRARLGLLLEHFSRLDDEREPWRVMCNRPLNLPITHIASEWRY